MRFKTITAKLLTIVRLIVEPITNLAKPKAYLETYLSIRQPPWTGTSSKPVISPSLSSFFSFGNILTLNRYWWSTVDIYVKNSAGWCRGRNITRKMRCTASRNCMSIINLIQGGMLFSGFPILCEKLLLKQSWASRSDNSLIPINFSMCSLLTP